MNEIVDADLSQLRFFRLTLGKILDVPVIVSRTGYTGDLGYELWFGAEHAERFWDVLIEKGEAFGIKAAGILALDVARLEAGFILLEVDYIGAEKALIDSQRYSPFEIGLGWTVDLRRIISSEPKRCGEMNEMDRRGRSSDWRSISSTTNISIKQAGLAPHFPLVAWRGGVPFSKTSGRSVMRRPALGRRR